MRGARWQSPSEDGHVCSGAPLRDVLKYKSNGTRRRRVYDLLRKGKGVGGNTLSQRHSEVVDQLEIYIVMATQ